MGVGRKERGVPQAYVRARASSATLRSVYIQKGSFSVFFSLCVKKGV